jgi:hypothetical protein
MTKRITAHLTVEYVPMPECKRLYFRYILDKLARKRKEEGGHVGHPQQSYPALAGAPVRMSPLSQP